MAPVKRNDLDTKSPMGPVWIAVLAISCIIILGLFIAGFVWLSRRITARRKAKARSTMIPPTTIAIINKDKLEIELQNNEIEETLRPDDEVKERMKEELAKQDEEEESVLSEDEDDEKVPPSPEEDADTTTTVASTTRNNKPVPLALLTAIARPLSPPLSLPRSSFQSDMSRQRDRVTSREEIFRYHRFMGTVPRPFSISVESTGSGRGMSSPISYDGHLPAPTLPPLEELAPGLIPVLHSNRQSFQDPQSLQVAPSGNDKRWSAVSSAPSASNLKGDIRKVRTLFDPILPDELRVGTLRERLTVIQSFNDDWCVVGRDTSNANNSALSSISDAEDSKVELGVVPLWCFEKHEQGEVPERPARTTSLGITVMEPAADDVSEVTNRWSNYRAVLV